MTKNVFLFTLLAIIISFIACNSPVSNTGEANTVYVHRTYAQYGNNKPFMDEYGRVIRNVSNDTTYLEFCKDSTITFHQTTGKIMRSDQVVCYPQKEVFINENFMVNENLHQVGKLSRRNVMTSESDLAVAEKTYKVKQLTSYYYTDNEGKNLILRSHEYWNQELGLLLKMDEDFGRKRRRVISLKDAKDGNGEIINLDELIDKIYKDSSTWVLKNEDGQPWF